MKKISLLLALTAAAFTAEAQVSLSGTSYTQDFNSLNTAMPIGWEVDSAAGPNFKGLDAGFDATPRDWNHNSGAVKNFASKNAFAVSAGTNSSMQTGATDRALGFRQTAARDSGIAFTLSIANTIGLYGFNLSFDLQSLDTTSPRVTQWLLQYATGSNPTNWTTIPTSTPLTTGGNTFASVNHTASLGSSIDNHNDLVWIRVVTLSRSSGSGNRASSAIDNFNLTWSGTPVANYKPILINHIPASGATGVGLNSDLTLEFDREINKNTIGNIYINNINTGNAITVPASSSDVMVNGKTVSITNLTFDYESTYAVQFDSTCFDTAGHLSYGIYDNTTWTFSTISPVITVTTLKESFDDSCASNKLPKGWVALNVAGSQNWRCSGTAPNFYLSMNGFSGGSAVNNEDWLITPRLDLTGANNPELNFRVRTQYSGPAMEVLVSNDYAGNGDPNQATWYDLGITLTSADTAWTTKVASLNAQKSSPMFVAFKYISNTAAGAAMWNVDEVEVVENIGIKNVAASNLDLKVINSENFQLLLNSEQNALTTIKVFSVTGQLVATQNFNAQKGRNIITINDHYLTSGLYIVHVEQNGKSAVVKTNIR